MSWMARFGLGAAAAIAVAAGLMSSRGAPVSRTIGVMQVPGQATLPRPEAAPPGAPEAWRRQRAWRMVLRLDEDLRQPGPEWALREGRDPGAGYELAWLPQTQALQLSRGGDEPLLLGTAQLARPPREVTVARRGARLAVDVDGAAVLAVIDPAGAAEADPEQAFPDGWMVVTPSALGATTFAVQDDSVDPSLPADAATDVPPGDAAALAVAIARGPADPAERWRFGTPLPADPGAGWHRAPPPGRPDHALLQVRRALMAQADRDPGEALANLGIAGRAVAALGTGHPDQARLRLWLAWAEARNALAAAPGGAAAAAALSVRPAIDQLVVLVASGSAPEGPGMLLALLPSLAERAIRRPTGFPPLVQALDGRDAWLELLADTAMAAEAQLPPGSPEHAVLELRFIVHACAALRGEARGLRPMPGETPEWLAARWRALAGVDPLVAALPPPPASQVARDPVLPVAETLVRAATLEPFAAVRMRARGNARSLGAVPGRERDLSRLIAAIAALPGLGDEIRRGPELDALTVAAADALAQVCDFSRPDDVAGRQLAEHDPLAFALACLCESRLRRLAPQTAARRTVWPPVLAGRFARLSPFAELLAGSPAATALVWLHDDAVLPPAQALAAALAMREVAMATAWQPNRDEAPDWRLLHRLRSFTLPLDLLASSPEAATPGARTPSGNDQGTLTP